MKNSFQNTTPLARGYTIALISAVVLSSTAIFIRYLTETYQIPALVLAFWRDVFTTLILILVLAVIRPVYLKLNPKHLVFLGLYGLVLAFFNAFWTLSVALNGAAISTVLVYTSAGFSALLGRWILKESLNWVKGIAVIICFAGCILVSGALNLEDWLSNPVGILTGIISGLGYAMYSLMGRSASNRGINPWTTLLYTFGFATIYLLVLNLLPGLSFPGKAAAIADLFWLGTTWLGWFILFVLAAGPTLAGYGLYNLSLNDLPSSIANLVLTTELVFTTLIAYLTLGERLNMIQILGSLLIVASVVFLRLNTREPHPSVSAFSET